VARFVSIADESGDSLLLRLM